MIFEGAVGYGASRAWVQEKAVIGRGLIVGRVNCGNLRLVMRTNETTMRSGEGHLGFNAAELQ